jgi:hypothetical protein
VNLAPWELTLSEEGLTLLVHAEQKNKQITDKKAPNEEGQQKTV